MVRGNRKKQRLNERSIIFTGRHTMQIALHSIHLSRGGMTLSAPEINNNE